MRRRRKLSLLTPKEKEIRMLKNKEFPIYPKCPLCGKSNRKLEPQTYHSKSKSLCSMCHELQDGDELDGIPEVDEDEEIIGMMWQANRRVIIDSEGTGNMV